MSPEQLQSLEALAKLKEQGVINDEEFQKAKARLLEPPAATSDTPPPLPAQPEPLDMPGPPDQAEKKPSSAKTWIVIIAIVAFLFATILSITSDYDKKARLEKVDPLTYSDTTMAGGDSNSASSTGISKEEGQKALAEWKKIKPLLRYESDEFNGGFYYDNTSPKYSNRNAFYIYFLYDRKSAPGPLRLRVQYTADDWLFMKKYYYSIDGRQFNFTPEEVKRDHDGGEIWEWSDDVLDLTALNIISSMADSKKTVIRLEGNDYTKDVTLTSQQKKALRRIIDAHAALETYHASL